MGRLRRRGQRGHPPDPPAPGLRDGRRGVRRRTQRTEVIELLGCPPDLLLAHDDNLADIARELRLYGASHRDPEARAIAERISEIVRLSALSWDAARVVAKQAVHDGERLVDIAIATDPEELTRRVAALRQAVLRAEAMAEEGLLMTMPRGRTRAGVA